jgi:pentatricopeptide repeat protein
VGVGEIDLCLAAYDWFLGNCETPVIPQFYNAALTACGSHFQHVGKAKEVLEDCLAVGVEPSALSYNMVLAACSHSGQWEAAFSIFERCVSSSVAPPLLRLVSLLLFRTITAPSLRNIR